LDNVKGMDGHRIPNRLEIMNVKTAIMSADIQCKNECIMKR
jgi:hypothetical protein